MNRLSGSRGSLRSRAGVWEDAFTVIRGGRGSRESFGMDGLANPRFLGLVMDQKLKDGTELEEARLRALEFANVNPDPQAEMWGFAKWIENVRSRAFDSLAATPVLTAKPVPARESEASRPARNGLDFPLGEVEMLPA